MRPTLARNMAQFTRRVTFGVDVDQQVKQKKHVQEGIKGTAKKWIGAIKMTRLRRFFRLFIQYVREICNTGSMHGINHFVAPNRHYSETIFWILVVMLAWVCFVSITLNIIDRYRVSPTVISLERDHLSWNTTFPAATICFKDINETALEEVIAEYNVTDTDSLRIFLLQLVKISVVDVTDAELDDNPAVPPEKYLEIMNRIQINFVPQILTSLSIPIRVQKTIVEMGICYSINSKIAMYNSPEYRFGNKHEVEELPDYDAHQLDGELFIQLSDFSEAYTIYFHSPTEIPQSLDKSLAGAPLSFRSVILKVINLYSTDEVRELYLSQRKCRYMEENILSRSPVYSYSMCTVECRARKTLEICGCMPHYYKALPNERICPLSELRCLYTYRSALSSVSKKGGCDCLPTCETNYFTIYEDTVLQWDRWTQVKYGIREYPKIRLKREVLYGLKEVLVNCGGAAGLLLGCSVLTIIEVVYFVTLRLFWFIMGRRQDAEL